LKQVPISGLSPDSEPSASRLAELTEYIKKNKIKYIYFEENASQALASTLAKETGVELDVLNPLESLTEKQTKDGAAISAPSWSVVFLRALRLAFMIEI